MHKCLPFYEFRYIRDSMTALVTIYRRKITHTYTHIGRLNPAQPKMSVVRKILPTLEAILYTQKTTFHYSVTTR